MFSLTRATIPPGFDTAFWPGGQIGSEEDHAAYKERKQQRDSDVLTFIPPDGFVHGLAKAVATCKPRWAFARNINPKTSGPTRKIRCVSDALSTILTDYRGVINSTDICPNYLVDRLRNPGLHRMGVFAAMCRIFLYLADKNKPFCTPAWGVIRGRGTCKDMIHALKGKSCCLETGTAFKIASEVPPYTGRHAGKNDGRDHHRISLGDPHPTKEFSMRRRFGIGWASFLGVTRTRNQAGV